MGKMVKPDNNYIYDKKWAQTKKRDKPWANDFYNVIMELLAPKSVIDMGCGSGDLLAPFEKKGLDVLGIDASIAIQDYLKIKRANFILLDLREAHYPLKKYDLAMAVEVGEHVEEEFADILVDNICRSGKTVLWTADSELRGGFYHPNPQKPDYWTSKFRERNYKLDSEMASRLIERIKDIEGVKSNYYERLLFLREG